MLENCVAGRQIALEPVVLQVFPGDAAYTSREDLCARLAGFGLGDDVVDLLVEHGVLLEQDSECDRRDRALHQSWVWGRPALNYHFASRAVEYETDADRLRAGLRELVANVPPPSPYLDRGGERQALCATFDDQAGELWRTLLERRTRRSFARAPLDLRRLSTILLWTWGATQHLTDPVLGDYVLKTSPSGGARHPIEAYVLARSIQGLAPGVYHYLVADNELELVRRGLTEEELVAAFAGFDWFRKAPVAFVMTAVFERNAWKYRHPHAYRVLLLDAGHLGQTFHLVCARLGLAPFTSAALDDSYIETLLGLDPSRELVLYGAAAGELAAPGSA